MAIKPLKSIKFPGLPDTYTVPQVDSTPTHGSNNAVSSGGVYNALDTLQAQIPQIDATLTQSGQAADAKVVGDEISDLKEDLTTVEEKVQDGDYPFSVVGQDGKSPFYIDGDGFSHFKQAFFRANADGLTHTDSQGAAKEEIKSGDLDFSVCDGNGNILFYVSNGKLCVNAIDTKSIINTGFEMVRNQFQKIKTDKFAGGNFDAEINMFIAYGQSWSVGYDAPAITLVPRYDNIMFDTGIKNDPLSDMEQTPTSFVPMVEHTGANANPKTMTCGETPVTAMCSVVKQLIEAENGYKYTDFPYQMFGNAPGYGDKTLAELKKGTVYYSRLIDQVQAAYDIATALGKTLVVQAFTWQQLALGSGISTTYAEALEQLRSDIDEDVKVITGQTQDVKCITWQTFNRSAIGAAECYAKYVGASETYPNIICSGASYQFQHVASDNLHLIASNNDWAGAYFGVAYKRTIIDGDKFVPLKPVSAQISGKDCVITFNVPQKPLVYDAITVSAADNKGFTLLTSGGTEKTITSVDIIAPDKIRIRASENIDGTDRIAYGQNAGTAFGPVNGNRGNIRDSQGEYITYVAGDGTTFPIHNWLVIFDAALTTLIGG